MLQISERLIQHISRNPSIVSLLVTALNNILAQYEINTTKRMAAFLAQAAHESGGFRWFIELGKKEYFNKYEPGTAIGKRLGNTDIGDGYKFRGRGIFQLTGRSNYKAYGKKLGLNLIENPELAADLDIACKIACEYWKDKGLNRFADSEDIESITRRINGGLNGFDERKKYYNTIIQCIVNANTETSINAEEIPHTATLPTKTSDKDGESSKILSPLQFQDKESFCPSGLVSASDAHTSSTTTNDLTPQDTVNEHSINEHLKQLDEERLAIQSLTAKKENELRGHISQEESNARDDLAEAERMRKSLEMMRNDLTKMFGGKKQTKSPNDSDFRLDAQDINVEDSVTKMCTV